jgi:ElaB/YqjD/DUF883 family membrane-anchored ribosome-binding protein
MEIPANQPEFAAAVDPALDELNRIVDQAETLLKTLGNETGEAAEAARERITHTLNQAKSRLAETAVEATAAVESIADQTDSYVRRNPWQSVAIAAVLGGVAAFLITKAMDRK